ncbi:MAG: tuaB [Verrucomicrobia bacterium]|nr:tuaB [Verrucomicrobiota bacterium]
MLARALTKADFGLAALFSMTVTLLEIAGRMSFGQQTVQSKEGGLPTFQATSHAFQFVLSSCGALLILTLSYPMAHAMHVPQITWAFAALAIVPLSRGFEHLDYYRLQRELNYLPTVLSDLVPQTIITLAAWPLAKWLGDFRVIVWLMIAKGVLQIAMTHILARQPYKWTWHPVYIRGMWKFGWPLLLNGLLIFGSQQADQVLVGSLLSLEKLAAYALALSLVSIPGSLFAQVSSSLMLPILSRAQDDPEQFRRHVRSCMEYSGIVAVILTLPLIAAGEQFVTLIYGARYAGTGLVMAPLGAAAAIRFLRMVPAIASMARADTMNQLYSNVFRCLSLPLAAIVAYMGGNVVAIASCALAAEAGAAAVSMLRLRIRQGVPLAETARAVTFVGVFIGSAVAFVAFGASHWSFWLATSGMLVIFALALVTARLAFPDAFQMVTTALMKKRNSTRNQQAVQASEKAT